MTRQRTILFATFFMLTLPLSAHAAPADAPNILGTTAVNGKGLKIKSTDGTIEMSLRGYAQYDTRFFIHDKDDTSKNAMLARRVRPVFGFKAGDVSLRFMPDLTTSPARILDANLDYHYTDALQFRVGKFKTPIGLERLQSATDMMFIERGMPTNFAPTRDVGAQIFGETSLLEYQLGIFEGDEDLGTRNSDADSTFDGNARVLIHPFQDNKNSVLQEFAFGAGSSYGQHHGSTNSPLISRYRSSGQQTIFKYRSGTMADGTHWRFYPQGYWYHDNMGILAEYVLDHQELTRGAITENLTHSAWQIEASYVLTGEEVHFSGGIKPNEPFDISTNSWGAWEMVGRIGGISFDEDAFTALAADNDSVSAARNLAIGINWYLNENFKLATNYDYSYFDGGNLAGSNRANEHAIFSRAQLRF
jgi:phosphate-selective porin OprO/OprP